MPDPLQSTVNTLNELEKDVWCGIDYVMQEDNEGEALTDDFILRELKAKQKQRWGKVKVAPFRHALRKLQEQAVLTYNLSEGAVTWPAHWVLYGGKVAQPLLKKPPPWLIEGRS